ncbi:hypothetical protein BHE74_00012861 [Ensete ventricosum]|nr:hypothetical protein BHE74_00012861 [Ensete ventricosum]RZR98510.1 hypothetical protein BHM03_00027869 [Ensete ventricosum]
MLIQSAQTHKPSKAMSVSGVLVTQPSRRHRAISPAMQDNWHSIDRPGRVMVNLVQYQPTWHSVSRPDKVSGVNLKRRYRLTPPQQKPPWSSTIRLTQLRDVGH